MGNRMMLLDTHALVWYLTDDSRLPKVTRDQISRDPLVYVSAAVIWEIAIKGAAGKLELAGKPIDSVEAVNAIVNECIAQQFELLDISASQAAQAPFLKGGHKDPFDRMLAAQAIQKGSSLVSCDAAFDRMGPEIQRLWADNPAEDLQRKPVKKAPPKR